jgi:hypothetical protein
VKLKFHEQYSSMSSITKITSYCSEHDIPVCVDDAPAKQDSQVEAVGWHLMLAKLIAVLRACIPTEEREMFDAAHAGAHARRISLADFFSYILCKMRQHAPILEANFREVFRVRNEARKKARGNGMRSVSSSSSLSSGSMHRSSSNSSLSSGGDGEDDLEFKLQRLCVTQESGLLTSGSTPRSVCGKRMVDEDMSDCDVGPYRQISRGMKPIQYSNKVVEQSC